MVDVDALEAKIADIVGARAGEGARRERSYLEKPGVVTSTKRLSATAEDPRLWWVIPAGLPSGATPEQTLTCYVNSGAAVAQARRALEEALHDQSLLLGMLVDAGFRRGIKELIAEADQLAEEARPFVAIEKSLCSACRSRGPQVTGPLLHEHPLEEELLQLRIAARELGASLTAGEENASRLRGLTSVTTARRDPQAAATLLVRIDGAIAAIELYGPRVPRGIFWPDAVALASAASKIELRRLRAARGWLRAALSQIRAARALVRLTLEFATRVARTRVPQWASRPGAQDHRPAALRDPSRGPLHPHSPPRHRLPALRGREAALAA